MNPRLLFLLIPGGVFLPSACKLPDVTLATREPLKVDISMKLDVYNHGERGEKSDEQKTDAAAEAKRRKYNRQGELKKLRGTPALAETHRGLLVLREPPAENVAWAQDLVAEENADRMLLMTVEAEKEQRDLHDIQDERWKENVRSAYPGEWVEIPDPANPGRWKFDQKQSAQGEPWPTEKPRPVPVDPVPGT